MADQAESLRQIMKTRDFMDGTATEKKTRIITIASGKGGVGKTNVAINLAMAFSKIGKKVIVLDADLGLANVNVILGVIPKYNLYHLIRNQKRMKEILLDTRYGIQIVAGASGFSKIANLSDKERNRFITELAELSFADIIIIDTGAGVSDNVLSFVAAADDVLIVTTPEPTAITDAYGVVKIIATEIENKDMALKLVINRVRSATEGRKVAERLVSIAGQFLNLNIDYLGYVYDDSIVSNSVLKQKPFIAVDPKARASICIQNLASRLENAEYREGKGLGGFLNKLFG